MGKGETTVVYVKYHMTWLEWSANAESFLLNYVSNVWLDDGNALSFFLGGPRVI